MASSDCHTRRNRRSTVCRCGPCAVCGHGPHMGIHLPTANGQPWGHAYRAAQEEAPSE
jgi:hypothetical protein